MKNLNEYTLNHEFRIKFNNKYDRLKKNNSNKKLRDPSKQREYLSDKPKLNSLGYTMVAMRYLFLIFWCGVVLVPIISLIMQTFNGRVTLGAQRIPWNIDYSFSTDGFTSLFNETSYSQWMINSLAVSLTVTVIVVVISGFVGYAYSRFQFMAKKSSLIFITLMNLVPTIAAMVVFYILSEMIFNLFQMNRLVILVMIYSGAGIISNLFLIKTGFDNISKEIDDSAKMDGLSSWSLYLKMLLPLVKPIMAIIAFWSFMGPFGDIIISQLILVDKTEFTLGIGLRDLLFGNEEVTNLPAFLAGGLIIAIPSIILFLFIQKNLVGGLSAGAVKG